MLSQWARQASQLREANDCTHKLIHLTYKGNMLARDHSLGSSPVSRDCQRQTISCKFLWDFLMKPHEATTLQKGSVFMLLFFFYFWHYYSAYSLKVIKLFRAVLRCLNLRYSCQTYTLSAIYEKGFVHLIKVESELTSSNDRHLMAYS